jgi:serine/threonine-protein kinase
VRQLERGAVLLGKYRVDSIIGRGGMGLVVKARHLGLEEEVAIKMLRDDVAVADETITRFIREAQSAAKLKSEHIARIIDVGTFDGRKPYLVMEFLEGQDLGQLIAERGRLQPSLAIDLVIQACEALAEAHSLGIVHRDIKPTNLFLTSRPDGSVLLKILDFGISKSPAGADLSLTQTWSLLGSPAYMSPEQMRSARHVDARTDVWSLGTVLYEVLEGHRPFQAESFSELCVMVAVESYTPMSATPPELAPIIARCLAKNPAERYASVADLACDLACLAREPDKAQALVDRMHRMLQRGALRRTPAGGVPVTTAPGGQIPLAAPATRPTPTTPLAYPAGPQHAPLAPPALPLAVSSAAMPRLAEPSPVHGLPVTQPYGVPPPREAFFAAGTPAIPLASSSGVMPAPAPMLAPAYPSYPQSLPLPLALGDDARYLRPGFPLPRGASGPPRGASGPPRGASGPPRGASGPPRGASGPPRGVSALTATHIIARRKHSWTVALVTAVIALAAAAVVIVATRRDPPGLRTRADDRTPAAAPAAAPTAAPAAAPTPDRGNAPAAGPPRHP